MKIFTIDGQNYRMPDKLNSFQFDLYIHLIKWKWNNITTEPGLFGGTEYDPILPDHAAIDMKLLYPEIVDTIRNHVRRFPFRIHKHFNHMASSQAANMNLFIPILTHPNVNSILRIINPDFSRLATEQLDKGWRIEFWDEPFGNLGDKNDASGTDSDIAIAYYNHENELCLWLIEHKLSEPEFTVCGGFKSKGRKACHDCSSSFTEILNAKSTCYYHDVCKFNYWKITQDHQNFFVNHSNFLQCPFRGGMNQLWRNQLLALSIEQDERQPFKKVHFSVVRHPDNHHLNTTIGDYVELIGYNPKFAIHTSAEFIDAAGRNADDRMRKWMDWYKDLYRLRIE